MDWERSRAVLESAREVCVVGDVHGHGTTLLHLLEKLGFERRARGWSGPEGSRVLFLGDLIDRGTENGLVVEVVRELVEARLASCLMGNHEYNAVLYHTPDPERPGEYLRSRRKTKNTRQHQMVLDEFEGDPDGLAEMIGWFRGLPLAVETKRFRAAHACWADRELLDRFDTVPGVWFIAPGEWARVCRADSEAYESIQVVLKGPEAALPEGVGFLDKDGIRRTKARVRWWAREARTWGEAVIVPSDVGFHPTPRDARSDEVPTATFRRFDTDAPFECDLEHRYPRQARPVFFGHYWKDWPAELEGDNVACLDYSAGKGGHLVAYRYSGERELRADRLVVQPVVIPTGTGRLSC